MKKRFNLDDSDGCTDNWRDLTREPRNFPAAIFGSGSPMEWEAFNSHGKRELADISNRMSSDAYIDVLRNHLEPYWKRHRRKALIFQQDNAAVHASRLRANQN